MLFGPVVRLSACLLMMVFEIATCPARLLPRQHRALERENARVASDYRPRWPTPRVEAASKVARRQPNQTPPMATEDWNRLL